MRHLYRAGLLLAALLIVVFVIPRIVPIPSSIVNFGFHKSSAVNNEKEWAALPVTYAQSTVCQSCHKFEYGEWTLSNHKTVACENCHGPAKIHLEGKGLPVVDRTRDLCGTCHAKLDARPADFPQIRMDEMGGGAPCIACHDPHDPRAGMPPKVPHSLDGRSDCKSCHAPHEAITELPPPIPHTLEGRDNCVACHGPDSPTRTTAPPVIPHSLDGRSNCLLCHNSSGIKPFPANHEGRTPDTCQGCHRSASSPATGNVPVGIPGLAGQPAATATPSASIAPPPIPHTLDGRSDCLVCHNIGGLKPFPGDHVGRTKDLCQACHRGK